MKLVFREIYFKENTSKPFLEIIVDKENIFKNFKYIANIENSYFINVTHGCLDILNSNKILEFILNKYNVDYIDKYLWITFLKNKHDFEMSKYGKANVFKAPKPIIRGITANPNLPRKYSYAFPKDNELEELYKSGEYIGYNNSCNVLLYEDFFSNEEEYLFGLLNIIFSCNFHFIIKKCDKCKNFFITNTKNTKNCTRIYKDSITCNSYADKVRKRNQYDNPIKHLIKNVRDKYKNTDTLNKFNKILPKKKEIFLNDDKHFIEWILFDYYTEKGRKKIINRLGLSIYLN